MKNKSLVIVESPTKAKTISKYLPKNFMVEASMGHVRDLPQSATQIPAKYKGEEWAKLGVNVEKDFEPLYVIPKGKSKIIATLRKKLKEADILYLATDEDREGESISWHLIELLKPKVPIKRMVFHEITKKAITSALENCREVDLNLVKAQETRRILDRIYGYTLSPLLWKKIAYGLSAGRVQSPGLKMIVDREKERMGFKKSIYWNLKAHLKGSTKEKESFFANIVSIDDKKVASGKDFDEKTGNLKKEKNLIQLDEKQAKNLAKQIKPGPWKVASIQEKESTVSTPRPFITSTLQQEGNRKLGMSARIVMRVAQRLYEQGLITYMRTDSPNLSSQAISAARSAVEELFGKENLPSKPRQFSAKSKGAQEAHEAIRPAGSEFVHPKNSKLHDQELALYTLIWKRTLACQMKEAKKSLQRIEIKSQDALFVATGTRILFPGFLLAYVEGSDDPNKALEDKESILPALKEGQTLQLDELESLSHETRPPSRFTEASLIQKLEKEGIGRPSTYSSIIGTILERGYVRKDKNALIPSFTGIAVIQLLEDHFDSLISYQFTSEMEESLDKIAYEDLDALKYLKKFYSGKSGLKSTVDEKEKKIKPADARSIKMKHLKGVADIKVGRYGPYIVSSQEGKEETHASIPEDLAPSELTLDDIKNLLDQSKNGPKAMGVDPKTGKNIYCLTGRYGAYLQLGEVTEEVPKPKRSSLPPPWTPKTITVEEALKLLSLPRELGNHPKTNLPIKANLGRFGPYVVHEGEFRSLKKEDNLYTIDLARAVELLSEEKKASRRARLVKEIGDHPKKKKKIALYEGRYGPYFKMGTKNISLPNELKEKTAKDLSELDLKEVVKIVDGFLAKK